MGMSFFSASKGMCRLVAPGTCGMGGGAALSSIQLRSFSVIVSHSSRSMGGGGAAGGGVGGGGGGALRRGRGGRGGGGSSKKSTFFSFRARRPCCLMSLQAAMAALRASCSLSVPTANSTSRSTLPCTSFTADAAEGAPAQHARRVAGARALGTPLLGYRCGWRGEPPPPCRSRRQRR